MIFLLSFPTINIYIQHKLCLENFILLVSVIKMLLDLVTHNMIVEYRYNLFIGIVYTFIAIDASFLLAIAS